MVQLKYNGYKPAPLFSKSSTAKRPRPPMKLVISSLQKVKLLNALVCEHPTVCLPVGSLQGKISEVLSAAPSLRNEVIDCIRGAVRLAWAVKYRCQKVIGLYIETIFSSEIEIQPLDRGFLDAVCERISVKEDKGSNPKDLDHEDPGPEDNGGEEPLEDQTTDIGSKGSEQQRFLHSFMAYLFSGTKPPLRDTKNEIRSRVAERVHMFIERLGSMGLLEQEPVSQSPGGSEYQSSSLVRSVAGQVRVEIMRHYRNGTKTLLAKLQKQQESTALPNATSLEIRSEESAIENFIRLNRLTKNAWKLCPVSPVKVGHVVFSERELMSFFWRRPPLKAKLQEIAAPLFSHVPLNGLPLLDAQEAIPVGQVIKSFIADIDPTGLTSRQRRKRG
ncbi:hypothetical protein BGZ99_002989, partial [Dissophora globulifera]